MTQYTAIIVDDEANNRENLHRMLIKYCPEIEVLGKAASTKEALHLVKTISPEVVFLDIEMPGGDGFSLLEKLDEVNFKVIFVTAYDSYALNAIKFSALDYVLKPIDKQELISAVARLKKLENPEPQKVENLSDFLSGKRERIALSLADEIRLLDLQNIVRIEADNNYCNFHLDNNEKIVTSRNLGFYYDMLKTKGFIRVHQSHLINKNSLERYVKKDGGYLVLNNGDHVPVSRTQKENVSKFFSSL